MSAWRSPRSSSAAQKTHRCITNFTQGTHLPTTPTYPGLVLLPARSHLWSLQTGATGPPISGQAFPRFGTPSLAPNPTNVGTTGHHPAVPTPAPVQQTPGLQGPGRDFVRWVGWATIMCIRPWQGLQVHFQGELPGANVVGSQPIGFGPSLFYSIATHPPPSQFMYYVYASDSINFIQF